MLTRFSRPAWLRLLHLGTLSALALAMLSAPLALAQPSDVDEEDMPRYFPGLVGEYRDGDGTFEQIDDVISRQWRGDDARIHLGAMSVTWRGRLFAAAPGDYQLSVHGSGKVVIRVNEEEVLAGQFDGWLRGKAMSLPFGRHPIEIRYEGVNDPKTPGELGLFWQGPKFSLEPVGSPFLLHDGQRHIDNASLNGRELVRALRCGACHEIPGEAERLPAPDLKKLGGAMHPSWIADWLRAPQAANNDAAASHARRMPQFVWRADEVDAIVAALAPVAPKVEPVKADAKQLAAGKELVHQVGCLACHSLDGVGAVNMFGGGDLTNIASKRPPQFFESWLRDPAKHNADHRMPVFALSGKERSQIAAYLASRGKPMAESSSPTKPERDNVEALRRRGIELLTARGCAQCHQVPASQTKPFQRPRFQRTRLARLPEGLSEGLSEGLETPHCLGAPRENRPGYQLSKADAAAIGTYLRQLDYKSANQHEGPRLKGCNRRAGPTIVG